MFFFGGFIFIFMVSCVSVFFCGRLPPAQSDTLGGCFVLFNVYRKRRLGFFLSFLLLSGPSDIHTIEFKNQAATQEAHVETLRCAKALAGVALTYVVDGELRKSVVEEFKR